MPKIVTSFLSRKLAAKCGLALFLLAGLTTMVEAQKTSAVSRGLWGGTGMNLTVAAAGATIELDCATVEIGKQLRMKRNGSFEAQGSMTRSGPGPIRIDHQPKPVPVVLKGTVSGKTIKVSVTDADSGEELGSYSLTKGVTGRLRRCL
jgi:hypothetical protein